MKPFTVVRRISLLVALTIGGQWLVLASSAWGQAASAGATEVHCELHWGPPTHQVARAPSGPTELDLLQPSPENRSQVRQVGGEIPSTLPNAHGQVWKEYDIRAYTQRLPNEPKPEQAIIDWILRETGTEVWFAEPLGLLSANRSKLTVYHTPEIQAAVADITERFVRPETDKNVFGVRMVSVNSANWRTKSIGRLRPVVVQSPGVEAWLVTREDAAVIMDELRKRTDFREYSSPNLLIRNGQTHSVERTRPISYNKGIYENPGLPGNYQTEMGQIQEGFQLKLSPLLSRDKYAVDAVLKLEATQIERMNAINIRTPSATNTKQMSPVQVPQTSSWRLHERFRWPADQVLLISCGVVPTPGPERGGVLGLRPMARPGPPRADALIFVESKGRLNENVASSQGEDRYRGLNFRGRY